MIKMVVQDTVNTKDANLVFEKIHRLREDGKEMREMKKNSVRSDALCSMQVPQVPQSKRREESVLRGGIR